MLKLIAQAPGAAAPETFTFTFTSATAAREELNGFIEPLKKIMEAQKADAASGLVAAVSPSAAGAQSASMAMSQAANAGGKGTNDTYSDAQLLSDLKLQKALTEQNPVLKERLAQAMRDRPASMTPIQLSKQFWTTRIQFLRGFAAELQQTRAENNVIADIQQVRQKDGEMRYNFTPAKISLIWKQYPFMVKIYNELFKKKIFTRDEDFFRDWISSRLYKKMKGEKITEMDFEDVRFDRYLDLVDDTPRPKHFNVDHVPRFIDLEANEQNTSQQKGNAPDFTMRPAYNGRNAILNTLNNMSERLMMNVTPTDSETQHGPVGVDEDTFNELRLRDLQRNDKDNRIILNVSEQHQIAPIEDTNGNAQLKAADSHEALGRVRSNARLQPALTTAIDDDDAPRAINATIDMMKSIKLRAAIASPEESSQTNVGARSKDAAILAHSTTIDFLHYFWGAYLSGDATRADDVRFLYDTLQTSQGRFDAVAEQAEKERQSQLDQIHTMEKDMPASKRRRIDKSKLPGGREAVNDMLMATQQAVNFAEEEYKRNLVKQTTTLQNPAAAISRC